MGRAMRYRRVLGVNAPHWWGFPWWWVDDIGPVHRLRDAKKAFKHRPRSTTETEEG